MWRNGNDLTDDTERRHDRHVLADAIGATLVKHTALKPTIGAVSDNRRRDRLSEQLAAKIE